MEVLILDTNLNTVDILDTFESLIWTDRYSKCGDFEIYTPITLKAFSYLKEDYYLYLAESEHTMIIEDRQIDSDDPEKGSYFIVTGRSLESMLNRRIIWDPTVLTGSFQDGIKKLLNENAISPTIVERKIDNLIFEDSTDPSILSLTIDNQYLGEELLDTIQKLCDTNNIGFRITLSEDNKFVFKLYSGSDRSYEQTTNPYVVFSPSFDNLANSNYIESKRPLKTVSLVSGDGVTAVVEAESGGGTGLSRREMFTDASGTSSQTQLEQKGLIDLANNTSVSSFDGEAETNKLYRYGEDFFMGDLVQIANDYGVESRSRVIELIRSENPSGIDVRPTFSLV